MFKDKPLILSSVGRWHGEEEMVIKSLRDSGHELKAVIHLEISEQESYKRWQNRDINNDRGERYDDTEEILKISILMNTDQKQFQLSTTIRKQVY